VNRPAEPLPFEPVSVVRILGRGLRLRCPRCGRTGLFRRWFAMHERCAACGLRYEREPGYFVGAIYVNYALTVALVLCTVLGLDMTVGLSVTQQLGIGIPVAVLAPLLFFPHSRSLWLSLDYAVARADERQERRRR
jgi:uncharacterized protein (DUF983 family)